MDLRKSEERICYTNPGVPGTSAPGNISYDFTYAGAHGFQVGDAIGYQNDGTSSIIKVGISHTRPQANYIIGICTAAPTLFKFTIGLQGVFDLGSTSPFTSGAGYPWFLTTTNGTLTYIRGADSDKIGADGSKFLRPVLIPFDDNKCFVFGESMLGNYPTINEALDYYSSPLNNNDVLTWDASQLSWTNKPQGGGGHPAFTVQSTTGSVSGVLHDNSATTDGQVFLRKSTGLTWDKVDTANIKPNAITSALIADGTIIAADMGTAIISGGSGKQIAAHTIDASNIVAASITGTEIASHTITAANITAGTITTTEIASATIQGSNIAAGTVTNANLVNNSVTVSPGTGMSGGGTVALGGTITLNNTGLLAAIAGSGISLAGGSTFTITNSGVTSIVAGTGITVSGTTGAVTVNATAVTPPDATTSVKGIVQLAGDLAGTAAAPILGNNKATYAKFQQGAAYAIPANATSSTANFADLTAADGTILNRQSTTLAFTATPILGTAAAGGGTFTCNFAASKYFKVDSSGVLTLFQTATSQLSVDASTTMLITYANTNTVQIASADFVGTSKAVKLRELDICVAGVAKKILVLCSAAY